MDFLCIFPEGKDCGRRQKLSSKTEGAYKKNIDNCSGYNRAKLARFAAKNTVT